jgi:competence protein ComEA
MVRTALSFVVLALLAVAQPALAQEPASPRSSARAAAKAPVTGQVNINTASPTELEALPGIGAKTAARIIEYRQKNGPFKKVEDLMNVRGVGEKNFLKLKPQITVASKAEHTGQQ